MNIVKTFQKVRTKGWDLVNGYVGAIPGNWFCEINNLCRKNAHKFAQIYYIITVDGTDFSAW